MTIITMTTIGFGEVRALSPQGHVFTIVLIVVGVVIASYTITAVIEMLAHVQN
jgi:voltage-gated potassium channel